MMYPPLLTLGVMGGNSKYSTNQTDVKHKTTSTKVQLCNKSFVTILLDKIGRLACIENT